ncbi:hypothetical protein ACFZCV_23660 [Streptomyces sp. NPDC007920]|uniref:hypothetical protein n=1 Tax=Streptomyces sp. NPDC007920 TaxID=3364794 RepID=UPI0036E29D6D
MTDAAPGAGRVLSRLPARWWAFGLLVGVTVAVVAVLVLWLLGVLGWSGLPLPGFVAFMAVYTGLFGYVMTRWVILRRLSERRAGAAAAGC